MKLWSVELGESEEVFIWGLEVSSAQQEPIEEGLNSLSLQLVPATL